MRLEGKVHDFGGCLLKYGTIIVDCVDGWTISIKEGVEMTREFVKERQEFQRQHRKGMEAYLDWDLGGYDADEYVCGVPIPRENVDS